MAVLVLLLFPQSKRFVRLAHGKNTAIIRNPKVRSQFNVPCGAFAHRQSRGLCM